MKKESEYLYCDILKSRFKLMIFILLAVIFLTIIFIYVINQEKSIEKNGERIKATVIDIDEMISMQQKEKRKINSITIKYMYNNKNYTKVVTQAPSKYVRINDVIDIFVLDKNPENIHVYVENSELMIYIVVPLMTLAIIGSIYSIIRIKIELLIYKKATNEFISVKANYVDVVEKSYMGQYRCYILLETSEINGETTRFKSHIFNEKYVKDQIMKKNIKTFNVLYNPNNVKQYIVDTNAIDKKLYH